MPHIPIRNAEGNDQNATVIYFPIPSDGKLTLDDLRSAFPSLVSLRYIDSSEEKQHHILCRDSTFLEPEGGWTQDGRTFLAVCGSDADHNRFGTDERSLRDLGLINNNTSNLPYNPPLSIGHGHFKGGKFSRISASSLSGCGGIVVVGPFSKLGDTAEEIKAAAFEKFRQQNRFFRNKYKQVNQFYLVYPDGSVVKQLPDGSAAFTILAYRNYVDPQRRFERLRLYLCEKSNYEYYQPIEMITDSSSDDDLPQLSTPVKDTELPRMSTPVRNTENQTNDDTLPLILNVTFHPYSGECFSEGFPNNAKGSALLDCVERHIGTSLFHLETKDKNIITPGDRMLEVTSSDLDVYIHRKKKSEEEEVQDKEEAPIRAIYECTEDEAVASSLVKKTLTAAQDTSDPSTILRRYNTNFLTGRPLDVIQEDDVIEGDTTGIFISRDGVLIDGIDEMEFQDNIRNPIEVTFHGESAVDFGGPRREFLGAFVREVRDKMCAQEEDVIILEQKEEYLARRRYFYAGMLLGLSAIQGGPVADFLDSVVSNSRGEIADQFMAGLRRTGIAQLMDGSTTIRYLFRPRISSTLTVNKLLHLLQTNFAEEGSNKRIKEEASYRHFVRYVRETYAGRRGEVTLNRILKFATGSLEISLLGLTPAPTIEFVEAVFPTASSCINRLYLPFNHDDDKYDQAFLSDYFGLE